MSKVTTRRLELDVGRVHEIIAGGDRVRQTRHLGNAFSGKSALTLGGLASHEVLVDVQDAGRDDASTMYNIAGHTVFSKSKFYEIAQAALTRVTLQASQEKSAEQRLREFLQIGNDLGVDFKQFMDGDKINLVELHLHLVRLAAAQNVEVSTFQEYWQRYSEVANAMTMYMASKGKLDRWFDKNGKIHRMGNTDQREVLMDHGSYYGMRKQGVMIPKKGMLAGEIVIAGLEGRDITYDHVNGFSRLYTQDVELMADVVDIALGTFALLGWSGNVDYGLIDVDNDEWNRLGGQTDHYDMVKAGERFSADALIQQWKVERGHAE